MGRRSSQTPDQIRESILTAAAEIVEEKGLLGLSAREIARRIGYSPGTIYNVFRDLDDVLFTIEARMLDALAARIATVPTHDDPTTHLCEMATTYLNFTLEKPQLWNLLMEHVPQPKSEPPPAFEARTASIVAEVERIVTRLIGPADEVTIRRVTAVLWSGVHGISLLATSQKLPHVTAEDAPRLVEDLVRNYARGLAARETADVKRKKRS